MLPWWLGAPLTDEEARRDELELVEGSGVLPLGISREEKDIIRVRVTKTAEEAM